MNSRSNSAQNSALLAIGQVCYDRVPVAHVVHALSHANHQHLCVRSCACPSLSCPLLMLCCASRPGLWVATEKLCGNTTLGNPSQHKVFCRDKNGPALGKLYRDTRGPFSRHKHLVPASYPVMTKNFYRDEEPKIFIATEKAFIAT